jgi:DNA polymerase-3 subunit delta'
MATAADPIRADVPEQEEARRLLVAALAGDPAHAYLFHGPRGVGKRALALGFAGALLGDPARVERRIHPDLYLVEPLGEQIRIDDVHALRRDLHLRPFEAARRAYLILGADLMNEDAADALLKSIEEPPPYAVVVLVADDLAALPETIRSRCQLVPFRRLSRGAVAGWLAARRPDLGAAETERIARIAEGRLDRAERLADPTRAAERAELIDLARAVYRDGSFDPQQAMRHVLAVAARRGEEAKRHAVETAPESLTPREREQRERRAVRAAEREEVVEALGTLGGWYRDLLACAEGAPATVLNPDRAGELVEDAAAVGGHAAEHAVEAVLEVRRTFELQVQANLALDALFVRLQRALARVAAAPVG